MSGIENFSSVEKQLQVKMFRKAQVGVASTKDLVDGLFKSNNYDPVLAVDTWKIMSNQEENFQNQKIARNVYLMAFLFSGYNYLFRFKSLSSSGKNLARFGFFFSYFVVGSFQANYNRAIANAKKYDEIQQVESKQE